MKNITPQATIETLWNLIKDGDCVAWIGSGLSAGADYPSWEKIIRDLCDACNVTSLGEDEASTEVLQTKADECKDHAPNKYYHTLATHFGKPISKTRLAYQLLLKLPFKAFVTTNYDPLLMYAGEIENHPKVFRYPSLPTDALSCSPAAIVYMHGLARYRDPITHDEIATGKDLVLSKSEFDAAYEGMLRSFLEQMLAFRKVLFLGCGLREPEIQAIFQRIRDAYAAIQVSFGKTASTQLT